MSILDDARCETQVASSKHANITLVDLQWVSRGACLASNHVSSNYRLRRLSWLGKQAWHRLELSLSGACTWEIQRVPLLPLKIPIFYAIFILFVMNTRMSRLTTNIFYMIQGVQYVFLTRVENKSEQNWCKGYAQRKDNIYCSNMYV